MDNSAIKSAVTYELTAAEKEHNPIAELTELSVHLSFELNRVVKRIVELESVRDDECPADREYKRLVAEDDESDHIYDPYAFADGH